MVSIGVYVTLSLRQAVVENVVKFKLDVSTTTPYLFTEIAEAIHQLWMDPTIYHIVVSI